MEPSLDSNNSTVSWKCQSQDWKTDRLTSSLLNDGTCYPEYKVIGWLSKHTAVLTLAARVLYLFDLTSERSELHSSLVTLNSAFTRLSVKNYTTIYGHAKYQTVQCSGQFIKRCLVSFRPVLAECFSTGGLLVTDTIQKFTILKALFSSRLWLRT